MRSTDSDKYNTLFIKQISEQQSLIFPESCLFKYKSASVFSASSKNICIVHHDAIIKQPINIKRTVTNILHAICNQN